MNEDRREVPSQHRTAVLMAVTPGFWALSLLLPSTANPPSPKDVLPRIAAAGFIAMVGAISWAADRRWRVFADGWQAAIFLLAYTFPATMALAGSTAVPVALGIGVMLGREMARWRQTARRPSTLHLAAALCALAALLWSEQSLALVERRWTVGWWHALVESASPSVAAGAGTTERWMAFAQAAAGALLFAGQSIAKLGGRTRPFAPSFVVLLAAVAVGAPRTILPVVAAAVIVVSLTATARWWAVDERPTEAG